MSKVRPIVGIDGLPLPMLPPDRDARVWAKLVRVMFYTPGFMALLLIKSGEPAGFGITIELLMLSSAAALVGGLFVGTQSSGPDISSKVGLWSGSLVLELLGAVPFLGALPVLFHELANSNLLHAKAPGAVDVMLGPSELLPMVAILPFMLYQLVGFGIMDYILPKAINWAVNLSIFCLIVACYVANRRADYSLEKMLGAVLVAILVITVIYGVLKLRQMQAEYDARCPTKDEKDEKKDEKKKSEPSRNIAAAS